MLSPPQPPTPHQTPHSSATADASFRNLTRPAVLKDAGVIIEPIRFSQHAAEAASSQPKATKRPAVATIAGGMPKRSKAAKK